MKTIKVLFLATTITIIMSLSVFGESWRTDDGTWHQDTTGTWYRADDGTYPKNEWIKGPDMWYYLDENGYVVWDNNEIKAREDIKFKTNISDFSLAKWTQSDNKWYRTDTTGKFLTSTWFQDTNGQWYYLGADGAMLTDSNTPDGHYVDETGVWLPNTTKVESATEYYVGGTEGVIEEVVMNN